MPVVCLGGGLFGWGGFLGGGFWVGGGEGLRLQIDRGIIGEKYLITFSVKTKTETLHFI